MICDLLIQNGWVADGTLTGKLDRKDVLINQGRILELKKSSPLNQRKELPEAREVIDATDLIVSPGFIDVHAHSELAVWQEPECLAKVSQGVTAELNGHCGISAYPAPEEDEEEIREYAASVLGSNREWPWESLADYRKVIGRQGMAINQGAFIGHGNLRISALGFGDRGPDKRELEQMKELLSRELAEGAFGLSSGLVYAPGMYAQKAELAELAGICKAWGGIYTTHLRNEGDHLLQAVEEAIDTAKAAAVPLILSHLKASGRPNHGKVKIVVERMKAAAAEGMEIHGDCYPYDASSTTMTVIMPPWTMNGGIKGLLEILREPEKRLRILREFREGLPDWENRVANLGYDRIRIASLISEKNKALEGLSLAEAARQRQKEPGEFVLELLEEEKGQVTAILHGMAEEDIKAALNSPGIMVCSDGIPVEGKPHPRLYGTFPRYLRRYGELDTKEGIIRGVWKLTGLPARTYGLKEIGFLLPGYRADLVLWDPRRIRDRATFAQPKLLAEGIERVLVSGRTVYREGRATGCLPGRFLNREK